MALLWKFFVVLAISFSAQANSPLKKVITFDKQKIQVVDGKIIKNLNVEMAVNTEQHALGLMFRNKLEKNSGMLFVFEDAEVRSFWMKNTLIDLDIGYFDANKKLIDIQQMKATSMMQTDFPSYPSRGPAQYALEVPKNWFSQNKIKEGALLKIPTRPSSVKK